MNLSLLDHFTAIGKRISVDLGQVILRQGDEGEAFYLVVSGRVRALRRDRNDVNQTVGCLFAGDHFGEGALLRRGPHRATVRAAEESELLEISRPDFLKAVKHDCELRAYLDDEVGLISCRDFTRYLKAEGAAVPSGAIGRLMQRLERLEIAAGTSLAGGRGRGSRVFLVARGSLSVAQTGGDARSRTHLLGSGDVLGAKALLDGSRESGEITAVTDSVVLALSETDLFRATGEIPGLRDALLRAEGGMGRQTGAPGANGTSEAHDRHPEAAVIESPDGRQDGDATEPPPLTSGRARSRRRFPFLKQHDASDCGAACLAMVCRHYRMPIGMSRLRDLANVSRQGTSLAGIAEAAESLGFMTRGIRTGYDQLIRADLPAILHWQGNHFVVLVRATRDGVRIADPAVGIRKLTREEFLAGWTRVALLLTHTDRVSDNEPATTSLKRFVPLVRPYAGLLAEVLLASVLLSLFGLASPIFTQAIVDRVLVHQDRDLLNLMLIGMVVIALFQIATGVLRTYLTAYISARLSVSMLSRFLRHLLGLPMRFFALRRTGDLTTRFSEHASIQSLLTGATVSAFLDVLMLFVYLGLMLYYNAQLTLVVLAFLPLSAILTLIYTPVLKAVSQRAFLARAEQSSVLIDSLRGIEAVKAASAERPMRWRWEDRFAREIQVGLLATKVGMAFGSVGRVVGLLSSTFILWYGATLVMEGALSVGQLMAFNAMIGNVTGPILNLIGLWPQVQEARIALDRLNDVYDTPVERPRHGGSATSPPQAEGRVEFEKVFYRYGVGIEEPYVLNAIDLSAEVGTKVAIVGRSGAGKTTLVKLIPRLFDPTEGCVRLDGADLRDVDPGWLRRQIGMVLQEPYLFSGTILENLAPGISDVDMARIREVARLANADGFIGAMPTGYETKVGEQGVGLSGGQRQRIAIARALYHDPRILILDEATNALDTESEQAIQGSLEAVLADRTAFLIAHRMSTIRTADLILVLDEGHVVESGGHAELLAGDGLYHHFCSQQLEMA